MASSDELWLVTATNSKFWKSARTLLKSLRNVASIDGVLIYDLGLEVEEKDELIREASPPLLISSALLAQSADRSYLTNYWFKVDGLQLSSEVITQATRDTKDTLYILWVDSGILINQSIERSYSLLKRNDFFLCDLTTRAAAGGQSGFHVKALNHLASYDNAKGEFPFSPQAMCEPLLWAGVHGYKVNSQYHTLVVRKAFDLAHERPDLMEGPKFVDPETRNRMEVDPIFTAALEHASKANIQLASRRWNGVRHDLFLYTCLFHQAGFLPMSSQGLIEDITDGNRTKFTAFATGVIEGETKFCPSLLKNPTSEFVIHRGSIWL